jgi:hypothetical protein
MEILGIAILTLLLIAVVVVYVKGMDFMRENHPQSKGYDLFDEEDKDSI